RPHPAYGTLEFRVPDGQSAVGEVAAIAAVVQALVAWLGERHDSGEWLPVSPSWQISENSWSACRWGVEGTMADLHTGELRSTRAWLEDLVQTLEPVAGRLGTQDLLARADALIQSNGAATQRQIAAEGGTPAVAQWLVAR